MKNRFNSTLRRLHGHLRRETTPASPLAGKKRKTKTQPSADAAKMRALPAAGSPASGDSAGTVHVTSPAESDDESDAIAGLEQLVQASLEVQRAESGGEEEEAATAANRSAAGAAGRETPAFAARTRSRRACASRWRSPRESNPSRRCTRRNCVIS